jgi:hypothetical protein
MVRLHIDPLDSHYRQPEISILFTHRDLDEVLMRDWNWRSSETYDTILSRMRSTARRLKPAFRKTTPVSGEH